MRRRPSFYDTQAVMIGGDLDFGNEAGFFSGTIDEVRLYRLPRLLDQRRLAGSDALVSSVVF